MASVSHNSARMVQAMDLPKSKCKKKKKKKKQLMLHNIFFSLNFVCIQYLTLN